MTKAGAESNNDHFDLALHITKILKTLSKEPPPPLSPLPEDCQLLNQSGKQ